ncbi:MAG TPA: hypothetical protein VNB24_00455 [Acidimicrobiales bacterium]|nr:hypothetical protein [Acidimicrobiales bacterium]
MKLDKKLVGVVVLAGVVGAACNTGFDKITERFRDAPRGEIVGGPADIVTFPDGFSNVASKCDGPNRVYVVFKENKTYGSVAVAANDPRCRGAG